MYTYFGYLFNNLQCEWARLHWPEPKVLHAIHAHSTVYLHGASSVRMGAKKDTSQSERYSTTMQKYAH